METAVGVLLEKDARRDAIHIALAPAMAREDLYPGRSVGVDPNDCTIADPGQPPIGVVDPFLTRPVRTGERFFIFLYPNTVTGMRHQWTHPVFDRQPESAEQAEDAGRILARRAPPVETPQQISERWLQDYADRIGWTYERVLEVADEAVRGDDPFVGDDDDQDNFSDVKVDLLYHAAIVLGLPPPERPDDTYFRCAC